MRLCLIPPLMFFLALPFSCAPSGDTENAAEVGIDTPAGAAAATDNAIDLADAEFVDPLTDKVFQNYLNLRTALVESDAEEAGTAAGHLAETFGSDRAGIKAAARRIADADELEVQRKEFAGLTQELSAFFEEGLTSGTIYQLHCPMAFDGAGADWFSEVAEVKNPFYGDRMLTCGRVEREISR